MTAVLLLSACVWAAGCAPSIAPTRSYNETKNITTYKSAPVTVVNALSSGGLGASASVEMQARASCTGPTCMPEETSLIFSIDSNGNASRIGLNNRSIVLDASGVEFSWTDPASEDDTDEFSTVTGVISVVSVNLSQFEYIARAPVVTGSIGNRTFRLTQSERRPLTTFLDQLPSRNSTADENDTSR